MAAIDEAKRFRQFRNRLKLTQEQMAEELGLTQSEVSKFERGEREAPLWVIKTMNRKWGYSYEWHFHGEATPINPETGKKTLVTDIADLKAHNDLLMKKVQTLANTVKKLVSDFYDFRDNKGTERGHNEPLNRHPTHE